MFPTTPGIAYHTQESQTVRYTAPASFLSPLINRIVKWKEEQRKNKLQQAARNNLGFGRVAEVKETGGLFSKVIRAVSLRFHWEQPVVGTHFGDAAASDADEVGANLEPKVKEYSLRLLEIEKKLRNKNTTQEASEELEQIERNIQELKIDEESRNFLQEGIRMIKKLRDSADPGAGLSYLNPHLKRVARTSLIEYLSRGRARAPLRT